jgi:Cof subfamily protein (haloacid dehalogenase superfamily)
VTYIARDRRSESPVPVHRLGEPLPIDWRPELIALDIDDTVVQHLGSLPGVVVDAIERVQDAGIRVTLATGRSSSTTFPIARAVGVDDLVVTSNGCVLSSVETRKTIEAVTFDPTDALAQLMELVPDAVFAVEDLSGEFLTTHLFDTGPLGLTIRQVAIETLTAGPVVRLVVRSESATTRGFAEVAQSLGFHSVVFGIADVAWMDVGPRGVNKATMLQELCARRDIDPTKTIAIGDSWNDVEMLEWSGLGVAMGSASPKVAAHANLMTAPEAGIGVAQILNSIPID